jgi:signal transduction protein with GAF and PtsI domain
VDDSVVHGVLRTGRPAILSSESTQPELKVHGGRRVYALVNVPLRVKEQIIGVLAVANRTLQRNFSHSDVTRLSALANYAAIAIENARLIQATRRVVAAEVLHNTVVTISHYINNPLMALMMSVDHLVRAYRAGETEDLDRYIDETERFTEMKVEEISAVISILRDIASPQFITYIDDIKMLDIDHKVQEHLRFIKNKYRG